MISVATTADRTIDLETQARILGLRVEERELGGEIQGLYSDAARLIILDPRLNERQRRCTLQHELIHAEHGDIGCERRTEQRTRRETALRLIDLCDYVSAEHSWDGDEYRMAVELNVTVQVIRDYRIWLHDSGL